MTAAIGYITVVWDSDLQNYKPFSRPGNTIFWYSKTAAQQEVAMLQNIYPQDKFQLATVRI